MKKSLILLVFSLFVLNAKSQTDLYTEGKVLDAETKATLEGAYVYLFSLPDTALVTNTLTDFSGNFKFSNLKKTKYLLLVKFMSFEPYSREFEITDKAFNQGEIILQPVSKKLKDVTINGTAIRQEQKGDTTVFNADAYKVNSQATTEDLIKKMPGITTENGTIKAHGEEVKKVLVDGKEFFGDDPSMALKNLPAEVVDKIEVYNKMSDQAEFTGFDDGNSSKTLNIITRKGMNNGWFGNLYAGYGSDDRYSAGGAVHRFDGNLRMSLLGLFNNVNQQNFSMQDLMAASGGSGGGRGGRGGRGGEGMFNQQSGITTTNSVGFNFSNQWKDKLKLSASYFISASKNKNESQTEQNYYGSEGIYRTNTDTSGSNNKNYNHRFALRGEYALDTMNSIIFNGRFNLQDKNSGSNGYSSDISQVIGNIFTDKLNSSDQNANNWSGNILFRHKFTKKYRTLSINFQASGNKRNGNSSVFARNIYIIKNDTVTRDTKSESDYDGTSFSPSISYTEPLGKKSILQFNYTPTWNENNADKNTNNINPVTEFYDVRNDTLSNRYKNNYFTQNAGISYRYRNANVDFSAGVSYQNSNLTGKQEFPKKFDTDKTFESFLPNAELNIKFSKTTNLRMNYNTNNNAPTINQLQPVVDNSNSTYLTSGNENLKQDYSHSLRVRFFTNNAKTQQSFSIFAMGGITNDYITDSTFTAANDMTIYDYKVLKGNQFTKPTNMNGYAYFRSFLTYGIPVKLIKSNLNFSAGINYSKSPSIINGATNYSKTTGLNGGVVVGSNINQNIDFTLIYNINYNIVNNSIMKSNNSDYYQQTVSASSNITVLKLVVLSSDVSYFKYNGLSSNYAEEYFLWNASIGYKFLKGKGELKFKIYDILNQNRSISRNVTSTYIQDSKTLVLQKYYMISFVYTIRAFQQQSNTNSPWRGGQGAPGGFQPPMNH